MARWWSLFQAFSVHFTHCAKLPWDWEKLVMGVVAEEERAHSQQKQKNYCTNGGLCSLSSVNKSPPQSLSEISSSLPAPKKKRKKLKNYTYFRWKKQKPKKFYKHICKKMGDKTSFLSPHEMTILGREGGVTVEHVCMCGCMNLKNTENEKWIIKRDKIKSFIRESNRTVYSY